MVSKIFSVFLIVSIEVIMLVVLYIPFYIVLCDDVEFNCGKKALRNKRKKQKGFIKKILFLDFLKYIKTWHFILLVVFLLSYLLMVSTSIIAVFFNNPIFTRIQTCFGSISFLTVLIACCVRWSLYAFNKVRNRPTKNK